MNAPSPERDATTSASRSNSVMRGGRIRSSRAWGPLAVIAVGLVMMIWTWRAWPDVLVDFGRELYVAWQLGDGAVLYTDIAYFNGPLSPYVNALWFRMFGTGLTTLAVANLALLALCTALIYRLLLAASDEISATAACLVFMALFAFAQLGEIGNFNFVTPYSHEVTHGILLAFLGIACLDGYARSRRPGWLAGAGLALGAVFLTKIEVFLAVAVSLGGGLALVFWTDRGATGRPARRALVFGGAALAAPVTAWLALGAVMPPDEAIRGMLRQWAVVFDGDILSLWFYRASMGTEDIAGNLGRMLAWFAGFVLMLGPVAALALVLSRPVQHGRVLAFALFALLAAVPSALLQGVGWLDAARPLPLIMALLTVAWVAGLMRRGMRSEPTARGILQVVLLLFGATLLAKIVFNARLDHYGFALAMPATLMLVVAIVGWIPAAIDRKGGYGAVLRAAALGVMLATVAGHLGVMRYHLSQKTHMVGDGRDAIRTDSTRGPPIAAMLAELDGRLGPGHTLAVLPEGAMLNYLLRRTNPTPYVSFMPPELMIFGEERVLGAFSASPPDGIVLVHRGTSEYGYRYFGEDYGRLLFDWVARHYRRRVFVGGPPLEEGTEFGLEWLEHRADPVTVGR